MLAWLAGKILETMDCLAWRVGVWLCFELESRRPCVSFVHGAVWAKLFEGWGWVCLRFFTGSYVECAFFQQRQVKPS